MRVPDTAGLGNAAVTLSFAAWKEGQVAPATLAIPVVEAKPKPKLSERTERPEPKVTDSKELRLTLRQDVAIGGLAYSPDGRLLAAVGWDSERTKAGIQFWDVNTGEKRFMLPIKADNPVQAFSLKFSPDGKSVAVATREVRMNAEGNRFEAWLAWGVRVWDIEERRERARFRVDQPGTSQIHGFDGQTLVLSLIEGEPWKKDPMPSRVLRLNLPDGRLTTLYESKERQAGLYAASPDGKSAVLQLRGSNKTINTEMHLLDLETGQTRPLAQALGSVTAAAAFAPDDKTCAVYLDGEVTFWDAASGQKLLELTERYAAFRNRPEFEGLGRVTSMMYSPDGKLLALAYEVLDIHSHRYVGEVAVWEPATGQAQALLRGHTSSVYRLAFAPDGMTLASGGFDKNVKLWKVAAGK